jgi:RNA polymerase sigma factor (TIGR02999 family)
MGDEETQITLLLQRSRSGDRAAESVLLERVYAQLHRLAERQLRSERPDHSLRPTALISDVYLRIVRKGPIDWQSRAHFFALAAETIRRILIDHARAANAKRRPQRGGRVDIDDALLYSDDRAEDVLLIHDALNKLSEWDPRQAKIVELRYFGGLSVEETAAALDISARTVKRDWTIARAWLSATLNGDAARA